MPLRKLEENRVQRDINNKTKNFNNFTRFGASYCHGSLRRQPDCLHFVEIDSGYDSPCTDYVCCDGRCGEDGDVAAAAAVAIVADVGDDDDETQNGV